MRIPLILAAFLVATPAVAQIGNPAGVAPGTKEAAPGEPAPHQTNTEDRLFVRLLAAGGMAEVDFGRLAEGQARSQPVKDFAQLMVADHTKANRELERLAKAAQIPLPSELNPEDKSMRSTLESVSADAFDLAYMQGQVVDHQEAVVLLIWEIGQTPCVSDSKAEAEAHRAVDRAKQASGERGPIWWEDGAPDLNRQIVKNTPYTTWYAREVQGRRVLKRA